MNHTFQENAVNAAQSSAEAGVVVFILNELMPWTLHTVSAIASAGVVAVCMFFLHRWLKRKFPEKP